MTGSIPAGPCGSAADPSLHVVALNRLLQSAEHYLACRDRVRTHAPWVGAAAPSSLGEAIARDLAGFDLEQAEAEFRAALAALSGAPAPGDAR